jgi:hypothetical protein
LTEPGHIAAAYWFTASTSFANPAMTLAAFVVCQLVGAGLAVAADRLLRSNP